MSYLNPARNYPFVILSVAPLTKAGTVLAVPEIGRGHGGSPFAPAGSIDIGARNGRSPIAKGDITMYTATSWGYRHPYICAGVRIAVGIWNLVLGSLLLAHGYRWGVAMFAVAALIDRKSVV